MTTEDDS